MTQAPPPLHEAVERLEAACARLLPVESRDTPDYAELTFGESRTQAMTMEPAPFLALNDLRTVLSHLRQVEEREAVMREALKSAAGWFEEYALLHAGKGTADGLAKAERNADRARQLRTALTHSPSTDGTENAGE